MLVGYLSDASCHTSPDSLAWTTNNQSGVVFRRLRFGIGAVGCCCCSVCVCYRFSADAAIFVMRRRQPDLSMRKRGFDGVGRSSCRAHNCVLTNGSKHLVAHTRLLTPRQRRPSTACCQCQRGRGGFDGCIPRPARENRRRRAPRLNVDRENLIRYPREKRSWRRG